jgi:hypothetical protein
VCVCAHEISPQMIVVGDYVRMRWTLISEFGSDESDKIQQVIICWEQAY